MPDPVSTKQTTADLVAIRARADSATPGPWAVVSDLPRYAIAAKHQEAQFWPPDRVVATKNQGNDAGVKLSADAEFIAHAREDIPALLAALEALAAENERLHGIEERAKAEIVSAQACIDYDTAHPVGMGLIGAEASRTKDRISRILHGDANAGGGE